MPEHTRNELERILGVSWKVAKAPIMASIMGFLFFSGDVPTLCVVCENCDCIRRTKCPNCFARIGIRALRWRPFQLDLQKQPKGPCMHQKMQTTSKWELWYPMKVCSFVTNDLTDPPMMPEYDLFLDGTLKCDFQDLQRDISWALWIVSMFWSSQRDSNDRLDLNWASLSFAAFWNGT